MLLSQTAQRRSCRLLCLGWSQGTGSQPEEYLVGLVPLRIAVSGSLSTLDAPVGSGRGRCYCALLQKPAGQLVWYEPCSCIASESERGLGLWNHLLSPHMQTQGWYILEMWVRTLHSSNETWPGLFSVSEKTVTICGQLYLLGPHQAFFYILWSWYIFGFGVYIYISCHNQMELFVSKLVKVHWKPPRL